MVWLTLAAARSKRQIFSLSDQFVEPHGIVNCIRRVIQSKHIVFVNPQGSSIAERCLFQIVLYFDYFFYRNQLKNGKIFTFFKQKTKNVEHSYKI